MTHAVPVRYRRTKSGILCLVTVTAVMMAGQTNRNRKGSHMRRSCLVLAVLLGASPASAQNWEVELLSGTQLPVGDLTAENDAGVAVGLAVNRRLTDRLWLRVPVTGADFPETGPRPPGLSLWQATPGIDYRLVPAAGGRWGLRVGGGLGATYTGSDPLSLPPGGPTIRRGELNQTNVTLRLGARVAYDMTSRLAVTGGVDWTHAFADVEDSRFLREVGLEPFGGFSSFPLMAGLRLKF